MRQTIIQLLLLALLATACGSVNKDEIDNLRNGSIEICGHGGVGFTSLNPFNALPANSLTSVTKVLEEYKAEGVEVDVQLTSDSVLVLYHDQNLASKTNLSGCINDTPADAIIGAEYICGFPYDLLQSEKIIALKTVTDRFKTYEEFPMLYLDLHIHNFCDNSRKYANLPTFALELVRFIEEENLPKDKVVIISMKDRMILEILKHSDELQLVFEETETFDEGLEFTLENNLKSMAVKPKLLTAELSKKAHDQGIEIITFGGKSSVGLANLVRKNPDVIQADNVPVLQKLLQ